MVGSDDERPKYCDVCRAPQALIPCARCIFPEGASSNAAHRHNRQSRPSQPILLEGKYRLLDELGRGGMGTVFRAIDESLERLVAIKFLLPEVQAIPLAVGRFRREARAMASINHHNVVRVFSFGRFGSADFIVTEFVDGLTVERIIDASFRRGSQVELGLALDVLIQASSGLAAVHGAGVVHRDVKPGNIMVENETGRVMIMDFGIGRRVEGESEMSGGLPGGTPAYMAPELIAGGELEPSLEYLVDIYAFGVTAFELLTSELPFDGATWVEVLEKHLEQPAPRPSSLRPGLPPELDQFVLGCLEKDPRVRFQEAEALRDALRPIQAKLEAEGAPSAPSVALRSERPPTAVQILVADEDPSFRDKVYRGAKQIFVKPEIVSASTATEALARRDPTKPVIIISSLRDRGLNGLELAATLAQQLDRRRAALIFTARRASEQERELLRRLGAAQIAIKPLLMSDIQRALRTAAESLEAAGLLTHPD